MKNLKHSIFLSTLMCAPLVFSQIEISGKFTHESASYSKDGNTIGTTVTHDSGDSMKAENALRVYVDGEITNNAAYHLELQGYKNGDAVGKLDSGEAYTQRDPLREAYIDTSFNDWNLRLGKQQVVWGTADGMKLLDIVNPTDFTEMAQNQMEDSRIPVWMINAERPTEDGGSFQFVVSQPRENIFTGLDRNIDTTRRSNALAELGGTDTTTSAGYLQGSPFMLQGVNSITGKTDGFLNIVPDLAAVAGGFYNTFGTKYDGSITNVDGVGANGYDVDWSRLSTFVHFTVGTFAGFTADQVYDNFYNYPTLTALRTDGTGILNAFTNGIYDTNLNAANDYADWGVVKDSTFEYMANTPFATFDAFVNAGSEYTYNMPEDYDVDLALRYKNTTQDGTNYSLVASHNYGKNPIINLSWRNAAGAPLTVTTAHGSFGGMTAVYQTLADADGNRYGGYAGGAGGAGGSTNGPAVLRFEQKVERETNLGGACDTTIDTDVLGPVVLRGEALYQKDVYTPVMDLGALSVGDLPQALQMVKGDRFKYVIGADVTALTNMMVSLQFIQDRDLDYIDETKTYVLSSGADSVVSGNRFRTDYATMSLKNGFNKALENKEFYSLFLSKPFGSSGQHRWNNIYMYEENDGNWNRFDVEYTVNDDLIATAEYNAYWGDHNTQFGQLEDSSNIQVGLKYTF